MALPPALARGWQVACGVAVAAGLAFGGLRAPGPDGVASTDVVPYLSPQSIQLIMQAPASAAVAVQVQDGFSVMVPAGAPPAQADAFRQDYLRAANAVLRQRRTEMWMKVAGVVVGACALAYIAFAGFARSRR